MMDMVAKENLTHLKELNDLFASLDADQSGTVTEAEARKALAGKWPQAEIDQLVRTLMGDRGALTYSRFMAEMLSAKKADNDEVLWRMFKELDADNNNALDANEVRAMLQKPKVREIMADRTLAEVMDRMGLNKKVSFSDFKKALAGESQPRPAAPQWTPRAGDKVQYFSSSYACWMDTLVTAIDPSSGAMQLQCKPGLKMALGFHEKLGRDSPSGEFGDMQGVQVQRMSSFNMQELSNTAFAFATVSAANEILMEAIGAEAVERIHAG
ncbi:unnamed protein product, partial [Effrenium voratum]